MKTEHVVAAFQSTVRPLRVGYRVLTEGESGVLWAEYDRKQAEEEVGWIADSGNTEFAERLTGLSRFSGGAGRWFAHDPEIQVSNTRIVIKQYRGLDI